MVVVAVLLQVPLLLLLLLLLLLVYTTILYYYLPLLSPPYTRSTVTATATATEDPIAASLSVLWLPRLWCLLLQGCLVLRREMATIIGGYTRTTMGILSPIPY